MIILSQNCDLKSYESYTALIKNTLNWSPKWDFEKGMQDLIAWGEKENAKDLFDQASKELKSKGLLKA